mmetsp:Transcript_35361/g.56709  ORF Transcript_35361/g.56709 Transcript_35361/m.56709 type:complete len:202 (-) Transcript_35361:732-1337(-)
MEQSIRLLVCIVSFLSVWVGSCCLVILHLLVQLIHFLGHPSHCGNPCFFRLFTCGLCRFLSFLLYLIIINAILLLVRILIVHLLRRWLRLVRIGCRWLLVHIHDTWLYGSRSLRIIHWLLLILRSRLSISRRLLWLRLSVCHHLWRWLNLNRLLHHNLNRLLLRRRCPVLWLSLRHIVDCTLRLRRLIIAVILCIIVLCTV